MSPPPAPIHSRRQALSSFFCPICFHGGILSECPLSTADGVKAIDVAWLAADRAEKIRKPDPVRRAPEICIEVVSPSNSRSEINEKRTLYFDAGAAEVWICALDGSLSFFVFPDRQSTCFFHLSFLPWPHPVILSRHPRHNCPLRNVKTSLSFEG